MTSERSLSLRRPGVPTSGHVSRDQILTVGLSDSQAESLPSRLFGALADSTQSTEIDSMDAPLLKKAMVVLSPVFGARFDAIDLAERLHAFGYIGRYIAFVPYLPDHSVIEHEVANVAPDLSFDIVQTGGGLREA